MKKMLKALAVAAIFTTSLGTFSSTSSASSIDPYIIGGVTTDLEKGQKFYDPTIGAYVTPFKLVDGLNGEEIFTPVSQSEYMQSTQDMYGQALEDEDILSIPQV